jgi:phosphonate transport system substrate-binding protein
MMTTGRYPAIMLSLALMAVAGCGDREKGAGPQYRSSETIQDTAEYTLAVYPLYNPARLIQLYQPLIIYVNRHLEGVRLNLEASRDYASFERKIAAREPEIILPNAWQTLKAIACGYHVIALAGDPKESRGLFVVRKEMNFSSPTDLKGKAVSYPSPTAFAACLLPQYFLHRHGINVSRDIENRYVGSQESSIMNVYMGKTVAGATWTQPWRAFQADHPHEAAALRIQWETEPLVNNSVMMREDIPAGIRASLQTILVRLHETEEGRVILRGMKTVRFTRATDKEYDAVRVFLARFEHDVRKVEIK